MSNYFANRLGKVTTDITAALTDLKPLFNFTTQNETFLPQARILNKLTKGWWLNNFIDLKLGGAIQLAIPAGCAYLHLVFDQDAQGGHGELECHSPRLQGCFTDKAVQLHLHPGWNGGYHPQLETVNYLKSKYPRWRTALCRIWMLPNYQPRSTAFSRMISTVLSPVQQALRPKLGKGGFSIPTKEVYTNPHQR